MRVAQVSCYIDPLGRGAEKLLSAWPSLADVAAAVREAGVHVSVVQAAALDEVIEQDGVSIHFVRERRAPALRRRLGLWASPLPRRVARRLAELRPQVVHLHGLSFPLQARYIAGRLPNVPLLVQDHADRLPPAWRRPLHRYGLAQVGGAAFTVRDQAAPFLTAGILRPGIPVFEVMESSSRFTPGDLAEARAATGIEGDPCLLWLGHLNDNKDPLTVLDALSRAAAELTDPRLWMCYLTAPLLELVRDRIAGDPALKGRVSLLGPRAHSEVESLLRAADFLVQGSHKEGSGYAVIEALACGTTPLVTDISSLRRITCGGAVGALSPPGNSLAMARALVEWSGRDRAQLRAGARAHFERELSFAAVGRQLRAAYEAIMERA
ncbi:MAG: glycosyltransferase family 4 protein [Gemmatimonadota bacterium]|nr:MAG: glycosyltransferase family 4 protein [Gemmatimonadota bacterium]